MCNRERMSEVVSLMEICGLDPSFSMGGMVSGWAAGNEMLHILGTWPRPHPSIDWST